MKDFLKKHGHACFGMGLFAVCIVAVFASVLPKYAGLVSPDSMPFFPAPFRTGRLADMLARGVFTPHDLYWLVFGNLRGHELTYILDTLVLALGGVYYLRSQRVHPLAAWFGGLALGLSGYTFTLFSAGHRGYFHMFSYAVWAFGFIARGFETRRLIYFAWLGLVLAWGAPYQPDVLLLVGALAGAYALWRTFSRGDAEARSGGGIGKTVVQVWPRFAVSLLVLVLAGFSGLREAVTTQVANRDAQIAGASGKAGQAGDAKAEKTPEEKRERWLFATNWSLPPEDVLEFVVPGVFGNDSMQPPHPYWGRLGRPDASVFQKGRMMPNYRQHTVYLGVIPVLFALFAVVAWRGGRKPGARDDASDLPFWCAVWVVCLLLAFGRYTPFYRLFYAIPYMDYIRAPVKFLHLVEIATAFLAGFGLNVFLRSERTEVRRKLLWLACGLAGALLVGVVVALTAKPAMVAHIKALGMGQFAEALGGYAVSNAVRSAVFVALAAVAVFLAVRNERRAILAAGALLVLAVLDQTLVARRYVRVIDLEPLYRENAVVKALKKEAAGRVASVVNYASQNTSQDWFSLSLHLNGIRNLTPSPEEMGGAYGRMFLDAQKDPVRLWEILQARAVIVPRGSAEGLIRSGVLRPLLDFELGAGVVRQVQQPGEKTFTLARVVSAADAPRFVPAWQGDVPADKQPEALAKGKGTVADAPAPEGTGDAAATVKVESVRGQPGVFATRAKVSAKAPELLVFDERLNDKQEILIDGKPAPRHVADAVWPAALVPAGEHEVVLREQRHPVAFLASLLISLAVSGWVFIVKLFGGRRFRAEALA